MKNIVILVILLIGFNNVKAQKFDNLAPTPPMGWNSWNTFQTNITAELVKSIADKLEKEGYQKAGYNYIVMDDGWMAKERDANGNLVADKVKFPDGLKVVADYVHSKGLKFGIYNCAGSQTCGGYPGSRGHEYQDALYYASIGVDYLKYDWCNTGKINAEEAYITMRDALYSAKRPVVFSLCEWGDNMPWAWAEKVGHLWRTTGDITPCWDCEESHGTWSSWGVLRIFDMRKGIRKYQGPNHFNDPDMMEIGNGMSENEDRGHFSLWAMQAAPLMLGNDIRSSSKVTHDIVTNKDVIAVDQDALGIQCFKLTSKDSMDVYVKPLANQEWAFCFLNRGKASYDLNFDWVALKVIDPDFGYKVDFSNEVYQIKNLWTGKNEGKTDRQLKNKINGHDVLMLRLSKK